MAAHSNIYKFQRIFEPSGVLCLSTGDILIIEDRADSPLHMTRFSDKLEAGTLALKEPTLLHLASPTEDLEGATLGRDDDIFLITSFSVNKKGKSKSRRQRLISLKIQNGQIVQELYCNTLLPYLKQLLTRESLFTKNEMDDLNIEGLAFDKEKKHLLIGLRAPLKDGKAILVVLENPYDIFSKGSSPEFSSQVIKLDLAGGGLRAITFDPILDKYLIVNEVKNKKGKLRSKLWAWDGNPAHEPSKISLPKMKGVKNIEGITTVSVDSKNYLLLVCDDGNRKDKKGAHYILQDYARLKEE